MESKLEEDKMLLGKRQRPAMKRTTSLTEITFDLNPSFNGEETQYVQSPRTGNKGNRQRTAVVTTPPPAAGVRAGRTVDGSNQNCLLSTVSPRNSRRNSSDFVETAYFLRVCYLCKRRLVPGRDIYMYRGDSAFCSLECRQQQMNLDERKEKFSLTSKKQVSVPTSASQVADKGETIAAL